MDSIDRSSNKTFVTWIVCIGLFCSILWVLLSGRIWEYEWTSPFVYESGVWSADLEVPCNKFRNREVGMKFVPPIQVEHIGDADNLVRGRATVSVRQGQIRMSERVLLDSSGWYISGPVMTSKPLDRFAPLGDAPFCSSQVVRVVIHEINLDLEERAIHLYISNDHRP